MNDQYVKSVREQYENFPFPHRDPEDEKKRLFAKPSDYLERINHYCFRGKENFRNGFRVLVAGGGTGDATIFLAEQLRNLGGYVTHLDMSSASIEVAKKRAKIRGLSNIDWIHESILNLPKLGLKPFDYINSLGVLHHMASPDEGLSALAQVLKEDGGMTLMVYGTYGRTGLYQMQKLLRQINAGETSINDCIQNARELLPQLPITNWFVRFNRDQNIREVLENDSAVYDALLHSCDRAYTVPELYEFVQKPGLHLVEFTSFDTDDVEAKLLYRPSRFLKPSPLLGKILTLSRPEQQAIAEIIVGTRSLHTFYVSRRQGSVATLDDLDNIPFFFLHPAQSHGLIAQILEKDPKTPIDIKHFYNTHIRFQPGPHTGPIFRFLDGKNSLREIFEKVRQHTGSSISDTELLTEFRPIYEACFELDVLLLRDRGVPAFQ